MQVDGSIFKAYDIRGIVDKTLTEEACRAVGRVLGTMALEAGNRTFAVGRDGRLTGERLQKALMEGIVSTGVDVVDIGAVPTPVLYFATKFLKTRSGVAVTGSHNPPEYNGLKMLVDDVTLCSDDIQMIRERIMTEDWVTTDKPGSITRVDVLGEYVERATRGLKLKHRLKVVGDAGNGIAGPAMCRLMEALGDKVDFVPLFADVDGTFPNHHPDPSKPANLADLIDAVRATGADYGFATDGDGDRLGVVTNTSEVIFPDRLMMLFAEDMLAEHPGAQIVYDVKCSRKLVDVIREKGGEPTISATGHSLVKAKLRQTNAPLAGEMSGHIFFNDERWFGFDDGLYAALRLLEILSHSDAPSETLSKLPSAVNTPELQIPTAEGENKRFIERLRNEARFPDAKDVIRVDGLRVEWEDGFALARSSNTTPVVVVRLEGDTPEALARIRSTFAAALKAVDPSMVIPE